MKWQLSILLLLISAAPLAAGDDVFTYTVQLVRGTDDQKPPEKEAKPVSGKLSERLSRFRWKHYWEIRRESVKVSAGHPAKVQLPKGRAVALEIANNQVEMRLYRDGKLARTARQKLQSDSCEIMGGTSEKDDSWFVVVRRQVK